MGVWGFCDTSVTATACEHAGPGPGPAFRPAPRTPTVSGMASLPTPPAQPDDATDAYVGLAADAAEQLARSRGWDTVRAVPPGSFLTMEFRSGRINFQVEDATVTRCWVG